MQTSRGPKKIILAETDLGYYEGLYTVRAADNFTRPAFHAHLEKSGQSWDAWAGPENDQSWLNPNQPYADNRDNRDYSRAVDHVRLGRDDLIRHPQVICAVCGSVSMIRLVDEKSPDASAPGIMIGGLVGGLLVHHVGVVTAATPPLF